MANTSNKQQQQKRPKHLPLRTCIACHDTKSKRELLRVVRTPDGHVSIDATGKKSGRGAYLCARLSCWQKAFKEKRFEHEFEITLLEEDRLALEAYMATLPADLAVPSQATTAKSSAPRPVKSALPSDRLA